MNWSFGLVLLILKLVKLSSSPTASYSKLNSLRLHDIQIINPRKVEIVGLADSTDYLYLNDVYDRQSTAEHVHIDIDQNSGNMILHHSCDAFVAVIRDSDGLELLYSSSFLLRNRDVSDILTIQDSDFIMAVLPSKIEKCVQEDELERMVLETAEMKREQFQAWLRDIISEIESRVWNTVVIASIGRTALSKDWFDAYNWFRYSLNFADFAHLMPINVDERALLGHLLGSLHIDMEIFKSPAHQTIQSLF